MLRLLTAILVSLAATVLAQPALATTHSPAYTRALRCAANAGFYTARSIEQGEDRSAQWMQTASERESRWLGVARDLGEGPMQEAERDYAILLNQTIPEEFKKIEASSDPVKDDPFTDVIVKTYEECVIHPPAPAAKQEEFERSIRCAAFASFYANIEQDLPQPPDPRVIAEARKFATDWSEIAANKLLIPQLDAESALSDALDRHHRIHEGLSATAKETYMHQIRVGLQQCIAIPPQY